MITTNFVEVRDNNDNLIGKRLEIYFNGAFVTQIEFPPEAEMDEAQQNSYIASKLSGMLS